MTQKPPARRCTARNRRGQQCGKYAIPGGTVCVLHGGSAPAVRAKAEVRLEVWQWGLGDVHVDPGETLLRLVSQSAARVERLASELESLVSGDESGSLRKALVAEVWVPTEAGDKYKAGEYVRALAKLEAEERDRCAGFCAKAIAAGLAERQVRLAERQGALIAEVLRKVLADPTLGLSDAQRDAVPGLVRRHLTAVS